MIGRYLKTKNGEIIDLNKTYYRENLVHLDEPIGSNGVRCSSGWYWHIETRYQLAYKDIDVIVADKLEYLCDGFVMYLLDNPEVITKNLVEIRHFIANQKLIGQDKNIQVYGAVYTGRGLIYIVKMKDILPSGDIEWEVLK